MKLLSKIILVCLLMAPLGVFAQSSVEGKVVENATNLALPGVSVTNQNTGTQAITDFDGLFKIMASQGDLLLFSFDGFDNLSVIYQSLSDLNVAMTISSTHNLDEVVVIGYGTTTYKDATGSVVGITEKDFNEGMLTAPEQLLVGKVAGLQVTTGGGAPGTGSEIRIRGGSSLNAVNDPLFVVDGVPLDNGAGIAGSANPLNAINPNDIESISILKDASATAIYGARASNGVIIITTKKGKKNQALQVSWNSSFSVHDRIDQISVLSGDEFRDIINQNANPNVAALLGDYNTNWQNEIFKTALSTDNNVSLRGVIGDFMPFRASVGYTNEDGMLKTGNFERTTGSVNLSPSFFEDHLKIEANIRGSYEENRFADQGAIGAALRMDPTQPVYSESGRFGGYWEWLNAEGNPNPNATRNPLALLKLRNDHSYVKRSIANVKFDYKMHFLPELKATLNLGHDFSEGKGSTVVPPFARMSYNVENPEFGGVSNTYKQIRRNSLLDFYLNYNKDLESIKSRIDLTAGYSYQKFEFYENSLEQNYYENIVHIDRETPYDRVLLGFFGRLNYNFNSKYMLTATMRRDATSRFSKDTRWGWFPSVALAWDIAEEDFLVNSNSVSNMKLRLGWGVTGQENLGNNPYPYLPIYQVSVNDQAYYPMGPSFIPILRPGIYDPNLKWEEQTTWNLGLDYGFYNNRLRGSIDIYKKETKDMIQTVAAALPNLNNQITTNIGSMENKGVELAIGGDIYRQRDFTWTVEANATFNENEITKISGAGNNEFYQTGGISGGVGNNILVNMVGSPAFSFYAYEQVYDVNGKPIEGAYVDQNGDGIINEQDLRVYHSGRPKWTLGLSTSLNYKNWDASLSMRSNLGNYVYNNVASDIGTMAATRGTNNYLSNIQSDALHSEFSNNQYFSDYYIRNASFLKMDYLTVGYTFSDLFDNLNMRLYGTVQNVFTITKYKGLDPELAGGIDNNFYPRPRIYSLGLNVNF